MRPKPGIETNPTRGKPKAKKSEAGITHVVKK